MSKLDKETCLCSNELQELKRLARLHNYPCTDKLVKEFSIEQLIEYLTKNRWIVTQVGGGIAINKDRRNSQLIFIPDYAKDKVRYFTQVSRVIDIVAKQQNISVIELVYYIKQVKIAYVG